MVASKKTPKLGATTLYKGIAMKISINVNKNSVKPTQNIKLPVFYAKASLSERRQVREQYIQKQNGMCYWCKYPLDEQPPKHITDKEIDWKLFPPNFMKYPIHLQHNHYSGLTEGAVHALCNAVMWQYHGK